MYVVIMGGGRIGRYIARDMSDKGHEVTVIERSRAGARRSSPRPTSW
jgi:Trk K+ transport system NAD-binding subunit